MATTTQIKEEFYVRRLFDDDVPVFVDATKYARQELAYPLSAKKSLKATCGVRTDDEVVAFSLRNYTGRQAEKEVENVEHRDAVTGKATTTNLLRPRMPRKTLYGLTETARTLADRLGDTLIAELDGKLYTFAVERGPGGTRLEPAGTEEEASFELPVSGVRLRVFLRSPIRDRILAYAFSGYLTRKPGEQETVLRAVSLALNSILGLATFRMLSGLDRIEVPSIGSATASRPAQKVAFSVPVLLFTAEAVPAARGNLGVEISLDRIDPVTGGLQLQIADAGQLEWNPAVAGTASFEVFERVLTDTIAAMVHGSLGADSVRDIAYDVMLGDLGAESVAKVRTATAELPGVAATPTTAEVRQLQAAG